MENVPPRKGKKRRRRDFAPPQKPIKSGKIYPSVSTATGRDDTGGSGHAKRDSSEWIGRSKRDKFDLSGHAKRDKAALADGLKA